LWALWCGSHCDDLFGTVVSTEPYTRELVEVLRKKIESRTVEQTLRIVSADQDRIRPVTMELVTALKNDGVSFEYTEYLGKHDQRFAAGPGGIDMLFSVDRLLRGEHEDGTPLVAPAPQPIVETSLARPVGVDASGTGAPPMRWMAGWDTRSTALLAGTIGGTAATAAVVRRAVHEEDESDASENDTVEAMETAPASTRRT